MSRRRPGGMALADVLRDVVVEMHARRARNVLMMVAVALSTGALITAVGLSSLAARQVDTDLAAATLDQINIVPVETAVGMTGSHETIFPPDAERRAELVSLVAAAGLRLDVTGLASMSLARAGTPSPEKVTDVSVVGMTEGYLRALSLETPDATTSLLDGELPVVLLGREAAALLDIPRSLDTRGYGVLLNGVEFAVVGHLPEGSDELAGVVAMPYSRALSAVGSDAESRMLVRTQRGGGAPVAQSIRLAVRPDAPEQLISSHVISHEELRIGVASQLARLAAGVGALLLVLTLLLIANAMVVAVMARTREIGVRRALGASRRAVAGLFLVEGAVTGLLGGLAGSAFAAVSLVAAAWANSWTAAVAPQWLVWGPIIGLVTGIVSSAYPAVRAAGVQPALAVRSD